MKSSLDQGSWTHLGELSRRLTAASVEDLDPELERSLELLAAQHRLQRLTLGAVGADGVLRVARQWGAPEAPAPGWFLDGCPLTELPDHVAWAPEATNLLLDAAQHHCRFGGGRSLW